MSRKEKQAFISTVSCLAFMLLGILLENQHIAFYPLVFSFAIISGGWKQTYEGTKLLIRERKLSVDLLMTLAAVGACLISNWLEGAMLTFIFCLSGTLEEYTTNKSKKEITSLMNLKPTSALKLTADGTKQEVDVSELSPNDQVLVLKGAAVPIDGIILHGSTAIDESAISGESEPVDKGKNEEVFGGTTNLGNPVTIQVTKTSEDTLFSKIIKLVEDAQNTPTQTAGFIEKIENVYVKAVLVIVPLTIALTHLLLGWSFEESFYRGMVLLVVASPCALVASATPATLAAISSSARNGILFKGGVHLEKLAQLKAIAFDKTGTLTWGSPTVVHTAFFENETEAQQVLLALESRTTHPLAEAIVDYFEKDVPQALQKIDVEEITGFGLQANIDGHLWQVGKHDFEQNDDISEEILERIRAERNAGKTVVFLTKDRKLQGFISLIDRAKPEARQAIRYFKDSGIRTAMITGDNEGTARAIAKEVGIDTFYANCLPGDKTAYITEEKDKYGVNAMVGDGINDAPALATASLGIAMGEGTDIAMDVADMVLMKNDLSKLVFSHKQALKLKKIIRQNIIFSLSVILLLILSNFFQIIDLPLGVIGHEGSTILVILNGLRMLLPTGKKKTPPECNDCPIHQSVQQIRA